MPGRLKLLVVLSLFLGFSSCSGSKASPRVLYSNSLNSIDSILTKEGVSADPRTSSGPGGAVRIDARGSRTVRLAEVQPEGVEGAVLTFRGHLRTADLAGRAYLEMTCSVSGEEEIVSESLKPAPTGTTDWVTHETRLSLRPGQLANVVKLNVVIEGAGTVWVDNVILVQTQE